MAHLGRPFFHGLAHNDANRQAHKHYIAPQFEKRLAYELHLQSLMQNLEFSTEADKRKRNRVFARSLFPMDREVRFKNGKSMRELRGVLHSISQSGLFVRTQDIPDLGSDIRINFLFGSQRVTCEAKVIYRNPEDNGMDAQGFGVKFTRMLTEDYHTIKNAIDTFHNSMSGG